MGIRTFGGRVVKTVVYWVRVALLTLFGPATLDDEHDPIQRLRREHVRARARASGHAPHGSGTAGRG